MICENPMSDDRIYILHTQEPRFLAEVDEPDIEVIEWYDDPPADPDRLAGLMRRMGDWYRAYCDWEDDQSPQMN